MTTTNTEKLPTTITTPRFRLSFPQVFSSKLNTLNNRHEYSVQALFEAGADLNPLRKLAEFAMINKFGPDKKTWPTKLKNPFKSQAELIEAAQRKGKSHAHLDPKALFMVFKTDAMDRSGGKRPHPPVFAKDGKTMIEEESKFYAGCWAKANVTASAYEKGGNVGVAFYLNGCQFVGDAEPFSGKQSLETAFEAIPEEITGGDKDAASMFT